MKLKKCLKMKKKKKIEKPDKILKIVEEIINFNNKIKKKNQGMA